MTRTELSPRRCLVTGANRGIGQAVADRLLERGDAVALGARHPEAPGLRKLIERHGERALPLPVDLEDARSVVAAGAWLAQKFELLDAVVHCAGVNVAPRHERSAIKGSLGELDPDAIEQMFRINVSGTLRLLQVVRPLLDAAHEPRVMALGTSRASMALTQDGRSAGYAVTKAALGMLTRKVAFESSGRGWCTVTVDPGWVRTDMGGQDAPDTASDAADDLVTMLDALTDHDNGRFLSRTGTEVPW